MDDAEAQLQSFLDKYSPDVARLGALCWRRLHKLFPTATAYVYDNYNALAISFGAPGKPSQAVFSITLYPRWVSLFFLQGKDLDNVGGLLLGAGSTVRHVVLRSASDIDLPAIQKLLAQAVAKATTPFPAKGKGALVIQSVSTRQRPRRPVL